MKKQISLILSSIIFFSCSTVQYNPPKKVDNATKDSITAEIDKIFQQKIFNGFAVSIVNENGTLYKQGFGWSDIASGKKYTENTIQNIASISKTLVGIALLKAQELGKLHLDDPVEKYLPFKVVNPDFPDANITIRQLATHTSSITDNEYYLSKNYILKPDQNLNGAKLVFDDEQVFNPPDSAISMQTFLENVLTENGKWNKNSFIDKAPGEMYEYSNIGTSLAGFIIEQATGESFEDFTKEHILKPLKMKDSGWKFKDVRFSDCTKLYENNQTVLPFYRCVTFPDGGFMTSIEDLSKYLSELIKGYNGKGTLLAKESYKEYFKPQLTALNFNDRNERNPYSESYNVGIFIGFGYTGYIGHTGGDPGTLSIMFFDPQTNIGRIMVFNTSISDKAGNDAFYGIWNVLEKSQNKLER